MRFVVIGVWLRFKWTISMCERGKEVEMRATHHESHHFISVYYNVNMVKISSLLLGSHHPFFSVGVVVVVGVALVTSVRIHFMMWNWCANVKFWAPATLCESVSGHTLKASRLISSHFISSHRIRSSSSSHRASNRHIKLFRITVFWWWWKRRRRWNCLLKV